MIQATGIHKSYGNLEVLKGIDLHIDKREIVSIVGASGAGKSTLLHIIGTLDKADRGQLIIDGTEVNYSVEAERHGMENETPTASRFGQMIGIFKSIFGIIPDLFSEGSIRQDWADLSDMISHVVKRNHNRRLYDTDLAAFRNKKIGFVFQFHHLLPEFTAIENICIPAYIGGMSKTEATERAEKLLDYLNLSDRKDHKPSELSGGEQQRVAVARALINEPAVVLADEPSGNLDSQSAQELHKLFFRLRDEMSQTFVIVTHNPELAAMSDRTITIKDGRIM